MVKNPLANAGDTGSIPVSDLVQGASGEDIVLGNAE